MNHIQIKNLYKSYSHSNKRKVETKEVFRGLDLSVSPGEFLTLFGTNGCGKTTLLNMIAGLIDRDKGQIEFSRPDGKIGYIFQNYERSLFPWRTNLDNMTFALELQGMVRAERKKVLTDFLERLGINIPLHSYPYQISGGQKQLVAIVRALIYNIDVLLMDEPFSALDYQNRIFLQDKLLEIWQKTKVTVIFVSHELEEAIYLADRTILLSQNEATHITRDIGIDLPRPRTQDMKESAEFFNIFKELSMAFRRAIKDAQ